MTNRKLVLRREQLAELSTADLGAVAGAAIDAKTYTCPDYTYYCLTGHAMCNTLLCP